MVIGPQSRCAALAQERYCRFPKEGERHHFGRKLGFVISSWLFRQEEPPLFLDISYCIMTGM